MKKQIQKIALVDEVDCQVSHPHGERQKEQRDRAIEHRQERHIETDEYQDNSPPKNDICACSLVQRAGKK